MLTTVTRTEAAETTGPASPRPSAEPGATRTTTRPATHLVIEGMTCASCVRRVERALAAVPGVEEAHVNLANTRATVRGAADMAALVAAVARVGYRARPPEAERQSGREEEAQGLRRAFLLALLLTLPVFLLEMGAHAIPGMAALLAPHTRTVWLVQGLLTTLVLAFPGRRFYQRGLPALFRLAPDMNALVAVGTLAAWGYSLVATFAPALLPAGSVHVYYEAAAVVVTLILLGRLLEERAKGQTSAAVRRLIGLKPQTAQVRRGGQLVDVAVDSITVGEVLEVRPGERVPVDGEVLSGESFVDEAMLTGEPRPVRKSPGAPLTAGTVNQRGALTFRATAVGEATLLAQIIRMVEEAQGAKLPIEALVDRVTMWFVPFVFGVAALTFALWLWLGPTPATALVNAVAVLIIACPCAMGLATPTAIMVGTGRGAELGILFRKGEALQQLKDARVVALDKTGTLTQGHPALTDFTVLPPFTHEEVLALVAAAESRSEHPLARAILAAAEGIPFADVQRFEALPGRGIRAEVAGRKVVVGNRRLLGELGVDTRPLAGQAARLGQEGKTPSYVAVDGKLAAILAVADPLKETTPAAVAAIRALNLKPVMLTGDNAATAKALAARLHIPDVQAELLPGGKVAAIRALKTQGVVAFVGDGINDAPALAEADVGIAIGSGTDIAIEAADVVLMSGNLEGVATAIALSRATLANIRQNLFWAFAYNAALIPVAAGVLYPAFGLLLSPVFAAGAMALSSVFVVGNALRLRHFSPPRFSSRMARSKA